MFEDAAPPEPEGMVPGQAAAAAAIDAGQRRRRLRQGCLVSIFTVALLTVATEVFLRVVDDRAGAFEVGINRTNRRWKSLMDAGIFEEVPDDVRRYAMRPGAECSLDGWTFRVSSHRSRGMDFPARKPANERRIVALGDSFCFGMWSEEEETLVGHLARLANERESELGTGLSWRAVNLGVPGYHTEQQKLALEQDGLPLDPDVVLVYFNTNDIAREGYFYDPDLPAMRSDHLPLPTGLRRLLWNSHLYGLIVRKHYHHFKGFEEAPSDPRVPWAHVREDNKEHTREAIADIAALCRARDIPVFFVNQPFITWVGDMRDPGWPMLPLNGWAEEVRIELELPGINLLGWVRGYSDGVDRLPEPEDFLPDMLLADEAIESALRTSKAKAAADGKSWSDLSVEERKLYVASSGANLPPEVDFHYGGDGYGRIAALCYPLMQAAGMLP